MSLNVDNCKRCGNIFQKYFSEFCPECYAFIRSELERSNTYLKNNRNVSLHELSEAVEVPINKLIKYINEGKLYSLDHPNLKYNCYFCEHQIHRGYLCKECALQFKLEVKHLFLEDGYEYDEQTNQVRNVGKRPDWNGGDKFTVGKSKKI